MVKAEIEEEEAKNTNIHDEPSVFRTTKRQQQQTTADRQTSNNSNNNCNEDNNRYRSDNETDPRNKIKETEEHLFPQRASHHHCCITCSLASWCRAISITQQRIRSATIQYITNNSSGMV